MKTDFDSWLGIYFRGKIMFLTAIDFFFPFESFLTARRKMLNSTYVGFNSFFFFFLSRTTV